MIRHNRVVSVARKVTRLSIKHNTGKRTIQKGTVKYLPFVYETVYTGHPIDLKSIENATIEVIAFDVVCVSLNIAYILLSSELKSMSKRQPSTYSPEDKKNGGPDEDLLRTGDD